MKKEKEKRLKENADCPPFHSPPPLKQFLPPLLSQYHIHYTVRENSENLSEKKMLCSHWEKNGSFLIHIVTGRSDCVSDKRMRVG